MSNQALQDGLGEGTGQEFQAYMSNAQVSGEKQEKRQKKVGKILQGVERVAGQYALVRSAAAKGVHVATAGGGQLHAELRILAENGSTPPYLAGTKRPCAICFTRLYPEGSKTARPGVLYLSTRALAGVEEYQARYRREEEKAKEFFDKMDKLIGKTHQAEDKAGRPQYGGDVTDWDDSDNEGA